MHRNSTMMVFFFPITALAILFLSWGATALERYEPSCSQANKKNNTESCVDHSDRCHYMVYKGHCEANPNFMSRKCPKSCGFCGQQGKNLEEELLLDMGAEQRIPDPSLLGELATMMKNHLEDTTDYLKNIVMKDPKYANVRKLCRNEDPECTSWAVKGECEDDPTYMLMHCPLACKKCLEKDVHSRCQVNESEPDAWGPGDLNAMFERITTDPAFKQYSPEILSKPKDDADYQEDDSGKNVVDGPWLITLDNFISDEECDEMIDLGYDMGYARSADVGQENDDGTYGIDINTRRTSRNAWCKDWCYDEPVNKRIMGRIENLTGIPEPNSEYLQLLKYEEGQYYRTHHDLIHYQNQRPCGLRILTVYLYISDVDDGGETNFPQLGLTVSPKKGKAIIWPSVLDSNPREIDQRTEHQALPVRSGIKFGANAWIHQRNFQEAFGRNCV